MQDKSRISVSTFDDDFLLLKKKDGRFQMRTAIGPIVTIGTILTRQTLPNWHSNEWSGILSD